MQHEAMIASLKAIKLYGMAQAVDELARQGSPAYENARQMLGMRFTREGEQELHGNVNKVYAEREHELQTMVNKTAVFV